MWRRGFAVSAVVAAVLVVAGVAIAAGTSDTSTETSTDPTMTAVSDSGIDGTTVHEAGEAVARGLLVNDCPSPAQPPITFVG